VLSVKALNPNNEEQLVFLADLGDRVDSGPNTQTLLTTAIFQTNDLDAFDSHCDEAPSTSAVLMAKVSAYDSDVLFEVLIEDTYQDKFVLDHCVQEMYYSKQSAFVNNSDIEITTAKCKAVNQENKTINESLTAKLERYKERVKNIEERKKFDLNDCEKYIDSQMRESVLRLKRKNFSLRMIVFWRKLSRYMCTAMHVDVENKCVFPDNDETLKYADMEQSYIDEYSRCLEFEAELPKKKDMVEKAVYKELSNRFSRLEKRCIYLEIKVQQSKESFQNDRPCNNQDAFKF
ncbi:hypothetical protein Tco_0517231, partial [Tanacetum coccineum]